MEMQNFKRLRAEIDQPDAIAAIIEVYVPRGAAADMQRVGNIVHKPLGREIFRRSPCQAAARKNLADCQSVFSAAHAPGIADFQRVVVKLGRAAWGAAAQKVVDLRLRFLARGRRGGSFACQHRVQPRWNSPSPQISMRV